jgi:hypothetical protein
LEKIPQPGDFNDVLRGQDRAHQIGLWRGVSLVEVTLVGRLCQELANALVERAVNDQIGPRAKRSADALVIERRPFPQNRRSVEIDLNAGLTRFYFKRRISVGAKA